MRPPRRRTTIAGLAVVAIAGIAMTTDVNSEARVSAPPPLGSAPCRSKPMEHVHDPSRLVVVRPCSTVTGVVKRAAHDPRDGDTVIAVVLDAPYRRFLPATNKGELIVKVIPTDVPSVRIPLVGEQATFHGAWVVDRNAELRAEIHPAWSIIVEGSAPEATPGGGPGDPTGGGPGDPTGGGPGDPTVGKLSVALALPETVPVGGHVSVSVRARQGEGDQDQAASGVHLFLEVTSETGRAVRWKALSTNTLGLAAWHMVTLQPPGRYMLTVHAEKAGRTASASYGFRVRRR